MKIFTSTLYRIPGEEDLRKFQNFPEMSPTEILEEFEYTIVGRGVRDNVNVGQIVESLIKLCDIYPTEKRYKEALELSKQIRPRFIRAKKVDETKIIDFCKAVKKGLGTIVDCIVQKEFDRINETRIDSHSLATLLALLEKHQLLDKKNSVNRQETFYQDMYKKMKSNV